MRAGPRYSAISAGSLFLLWLSVFATPVRAEDPLRTVRAFCQADGEGDRLSPARWRNVAVLVAWPLEPAWDRVFLVNGYQIRTPRRDGERVSVDVTYFLVAEVSAGAVKREERAEMVRLELVSDGGQSWRISGSPPAPRVFDYAADAEALAELLQPKDKRYESASAMVWSRLAEDGWQIPYTATSAIETSPHFAEAATAARGDLAVYYNGAAPYHVGWVESAETVQSATLNAGRVTAPFSAFPGSIRYWRPQRAAPGPTPAGAATPAEPPRRRK